MYSILVDETLSAPLFNNPSVISLFNPKNIKIDKGWDDQLYINSIKYKLKFKQLPLQLFPTGQYYYEYNKNIYPYLIHFNFLVGHEKEKKMRHYNKWYVSKKVKICQYGTDGFGHQLEGMLRLLSLSINNKAEYYNFDKVYNFEHTNFDINYYFEGKYTDSGKYLLDLINSAFILAK
jgi:hypothetical protein